MKIRKITEYTEKGVIEEKFNLIIEEKEEGWELDIKEITALRELINVAVGSIPYSNITRSFIEDVDTAINKYGEGEVFQELGQREITSLDPYVETSSPGVICEKGACRLVLEEEEPEVESYENITKSEDKSKDKKKSGRKIKRDFSKYIQLYEDGVDQKEIKNLIQDEMQIGNLTAEQYFYTNVKKVAKAKEAQSKPEIVEKEKKQLLKELEPKINRKKVDQELFEVINSLPEYTTPQQFKDACAAADVGRGRYSVTSLKDIYQDTHPEVRW